jgi:hypothetical protein
MQQIIDPLHCFHNNRGPVVVPRSSFQAMRSLLVGLLLVIHTGVAAQPGYEAFKKEMEAAAEVETQRLYQEDQQQRRERDQWMLVVGAIVACALCAFVEYVQDRLPRMLQGKIWLTAFLWQLLLYWGLALPNINWSSPAIEHAIVPTIMRDSTTVFGYSVLGYLLYRTLKWLSKRIVVRRS